MCARCGVGRHTSGAARARSPSVLHSPPWMPPPQAASTRPRRLPTLTLFFGLLALVLLACATAIHSVGLSLGGQSFCDRAAMAPYRPQYVCFGDSITQRGFNPGGWTSALADAYQRRVDVINRGYSGYNTRWAVELLGRAFPSATKGTIELATIWFGANDAALPDRTRWVGAYVWRGEEAAGRRHLARSLRGGRWAERAIGGVPLGVARRSRPLPLPFTSARQHVPLDEYKSNLRRIVAHFQALGVGAIVVITPPPISEYHRKIHVRNVSEVVGRAPCCAWGWVVGWVGGEWAAGARSAAGAANHAPPPRLTRHPPTTLLTRHPCATCHRRTAWS